MPSSDTSTLLCGTDWQASSTVSAPTFCAAPTSSSTGLTVPSTFDWWVKATTLVRELISWSMLDRSSRKSSVSENHRIVARTDGKAPERAVKTAPAARSGGTNRRISQRIGDQIDGLGGVLGEDQFFRPTGADEGSGALSRAFVEVGGLFGQRVGAAVHGRVM